MPILANPMSISAQSEDICLDNLGTSPLYGMVPSLLGGRIMAQSSQLAKPSVSTEDNIEPTAIP